MHFQSKKIHKMRMSSGAEPHETLTLSLKKFKSFLYRYRPPIFSKKYSNPEILDPSPNVLTLSYQNASNNKNRVLLINLQRISFSFYR